MALSLSSPPLPKHCRTCDLPLPQAQWSRGMQSSSRKRTSTLSIGAYYTHTLQCKANSTICTATAAQILVQESHQDLKQDQRKLHFCLLSHSGLQKDCKLGHLISTLTPLYRSGLGTRTNAAISQVFNPNLEAWHKHENGIVNIFFKRFYFHQIYRYTYLQGCSCQPKIYPSQEMNS